MIFNFKKNKDKVFNVNLGNLDEFTDLLAEKLNNKNDEVMSLTQENERLQREYDAKAYTVNQLENKLKDANKTIQDGHDIIRNMKNNSEKIVSNNKELKKELTRVKNNYDELSKKKPDKKLKERNKELEKLLKNSENLIESNTIYRMTYEYISDSKNKASVKDVFKHNLNVWMDNEGLTNVKAAELLDVSDSAIAEWKNGRTALTVNSIQEVDLVLCEYFECSVYELVTVKLNKEASQ